MSIYAREKLRDLMLSTWPPQDPTEHAFITEKIQYAMKCGLVAREDVHYGLRYACGYQDMTQGNRISHFFKVLGELTGYTNEAFVQRYFHDESTQVKQVKVAVMESIGLWN